MNNSYTQVFLSMCICLLALVEIFIKPQVYYIKPNLSSVPCMKAVEICFTSLYKCRIVSSGHVTGFQTDWPMNWELYHLPCCMSASCTGNVLSCTENPSQIQWTLGTMLAWVIQSFMNCLELGCWRTTCPWGIGVRSQCATSLPPV